MRPIPVAFHIWFLEIHTYGIGLALTFWFGLRYLERRLRGAGYPWQWATGMFVWVIVAAIVGARLMSVVSNLGYYADNPRQIVAVWEGGLSSFGGLLLAIPVGIAVTRRKCPQLSVVRMLDLIAPVLMACWGLGRLLGPQLMRAGGGHPTTQWFGMYYADQAGKRLPVPIFQAMEDFAIFGVLLVVERWLRQQAPTPREATASPATPGSSPAGVDAAAADRAPAARPLPPAGIVIGVAMVLWGIERFLDEHLWLGEDGRLGSELVQLAGIALIVGGIVVLASRYQPLQRWRSGASVAAGAGPAAAGAGPDDAVDPPHDTTAGRDAPSDLPLAPMRGAPGPSRRG